MSDKALLAIFGFFFLVMLSIVVGIAIPSKSARAKFKAWGAENWPKFKAWALETLKDIRDLPLFCLFIVSCLVLRGDDD